VTELKRQVLGGFVVSVLRLQVSAFRVVMKVKLTRPISDSRDSKLIGV